MPRIIAKDKEILSNIRQYGDLLDELSSDNYINDQAYKQLYENIGDQYNNTKILLKYVDDLKKKIENLTIVYHRNIRDSRWVVDQQPAEKLRRAELARKRRLENKQCFKTCVCGDQLAKSYFKDHLKTEKHAQRHQNLIYQKGKIKHNLTKLLYLNLHFLKYQNKYVNLYNPYHKFYEIVLINGYEMKRIDILEMLIKRWKLNHKF